MSDKSSASEEVVIKEYPNLTLWLDGNQVRTAGNLILTNKRLVFLRQTALSEKEVESLQKLSQEAITEQQTSLPTIISAKLSFHSGFPVPQSYMRVYYKTGGKNVKTLSFRFTLPLLKRLLMSEFPTLDWVRAINKAVKAHSSRAA
jgi:hypothetical protein